MKEIASDFITKSSTKAADKDHRRYMPVQRRT